MKKQYSLNRNKYLLDPEFNELNRIIDNYLNPSDRDAIILKLALSTGARALELLNLRHSDLSGYDSSVFITGIKGSNDRELPLRPRFFQDIVNYSKINNIEGNMKLFPISYQRLRQIWFFYRPVKKKFHSLRHTFAIRLYKKTKDIRLLQVALGHRNINNTMIYADYLYSKEELKKLML